MPKTKLTEYEEILTKIIHNIVEKLVSSAILYDSKLSYTTSFFLAVIAEEEMSKLFLLPLANESGELQNLLSQKNSPFYNHRTKQRIFSNYVFFERNWNEIEAKKQRSLYVGLDHKNKISFCYITPKENLEEIKNAIWLFQYQMKHIASEKTLSSNFIKICHFYNNTLAGCIKEKIPELIDFMKTDTKKSASRIKKNKIQTIYIESLLKNPYELIRISKAILGNDKYKNFLKIVPTLSFEELVDKLYNNSK